MFELSVNFLDFELYDRKNKTVSRLTLVWVPFIVQETVFSLVQPQLERNAMNFAIAALNDLKISVDEAVQTLETL